MSAKDATGLVIGGEPRIDFLPPEVKAGKQAKRTRRSLAGLVILVIVVCAAGYIFSVSLAAQSQVRLADEQARTQQLLAEQAKFSEARSISSSLTSIQNVRRAGTTPEVLWAKYLAELQAALPVGMSVDTLAVDSQTALESAPIATVPLQNSRVATIVFTAHAASLPDFDALLVNLRKLTGYADAVVTTVTLEDGIYRGAVVLNVNAEAFEKRFFEGYTASAAEPATDSDDDATAGPSDETLESEAQQ